MLPNSFEFYFLVVFILGTYYVVGQRWRTPLLVVFSYFFYAVWDWRFLFLLVWQTLFCYWVGISIKSCYSQKKRRVLVSLFLINSLGILVVFKYFNLFSESLRVLFNSLNLQYLIPQINILLPLGISFYIFQSLGYLLDVYNGRIDAEKNIVTFALFVSFFPQIVCGPIGRASELLPQFHWKREFSPEVFESGISQIIWGLFKKVVIADRLAFYVDAIYNNPSAQGSLSLCLAAVFFSIQIYCDFSGYTDVAIGVARLFNIELRRNFDFPYFATSINEFWKRWHISLTSWFRDYLYIPLGGNRCSKLRHMFNVMAVFLLSGLWHGANWTFLAWGGLHGTMQLLENSVRGRKPVGYDSLLCKSLACIMTFILVTLAWIFFRSPDFHTAFVFFKGICSLRGGIAFGVSLNTFAINLALLFIFSLMEVWNYSHAAKQGPFWRRSLKYAVLLAMIAMFGQMSRGFIYQHF